MSEKLKKQTRYSYVWEFIVPETSAPEFEKYYGPKGHWTTLFGQSDGYLNTELLRDKTNSLRYLTIDHWQSEEHYSEFLSMFKVAYDELDSRCEELTSQETKIGTFTQVG